VDRPVLAVKQRLTAFHLLQRGSNQSSRAYSGVDGVLRRIDRAFFVKVDAGEIQLQAIQNH
jgi:hypothetical protein